MRYRLSLSERPRISTQPLLKRFEIVLPNGGSARRFAAEDRFSFGRFNSGADVEDAVEIVPGDQQAAAIVGHTRGGNGVGDGLSGPYLL